jgi:hypothetical protein
VSAACTFGVESVNDTALECFDGRFHKTGLIERVGVDGYLDILLISYG